MKIEQKKETQDKRKERKTEKKEWIYNDNGKNDNTEKLIETN